MKPHRTFNGTVGRPSVDQGGPDQIEKDLDSLFNMFDPNAPSGGIGTDNLNFNLGNEVKPTINSLIAQHNTDSQAHEGRFQSITNLINTTRTALENLVATTKKALEDAFSQTITDSHTHANKGFLDGLSNTVIDQRIDNKLEEFSVHGGGLTQEQLNKINNAVPNIRKVNEKTLSQDITLTASDVKAVPVTRKVNNKALSSDITLTATDVGARPSNWTPTASDVGISNATYLNKLTDTYINGMIDAKINSLGRAESGVY